MKRIAALLLVLALCFALGGCSLAKAYLVMKDVKELAQEPEAGREVEVKIVHGYKLPSVGEPQVWEGIRSEETVCGIAAALLKQYQRDGYFPDYLLQKLVHDVDNDIWIVAFWPPDTDIPGADVQIAFDGKTGGVIGAWPGE